MSEWGGTFTKYTRVIGWKAAAHLGNGATSIIGGEPTKATGAGRPSGQSREMMDAKVCLNCTKPKCEGAYTCYLRERKRQEAMKEADGG